MMQVCVLQTVLIFLPIATSMYTVCPCGNGGRVLVQQNTTKEGNYFSYKETCNLAKLRDWKTSYVEAFKEGWLAKLDNHESLKEADACIANCSRLENVHMKTDTFATTKFWYGLRYHCNQSAWIWEKDHSLFSNGKLPNECKSYPPNDMCSLLEEKNGSWEPKTATCATPFRGFLCEFDANLLPGDVPAIFMINPTNEHEGTTQTPLILNPQNETTVNLEKALALNENEPLNVTNNILSEISRSMGDIVQNGEPIAAKNLIKTTDLFKKFARKFKWQIKGNSSDVIHFAKELLQISSMVLDERNAPTWIESSNRMRKKSTYNSKYRPISVARLLSRAVAAGRNHLRGNIQAGSVSLRILKLDASSEIRDTSSKSESRMKNRMSVSITFHNLSQLLRKTENNFDSLAETSDLLSYTSYDHRGKKVSLPVTFTLAAKTQGRNGSGAKRTPSCQFYDYKRSVWSPYGCEVLKTGHDTVTCHCNHTTVFGILLVNADVSVLHFKDDVQCYRKYWSRLLGYVCHSVSIVFLVLTILCFRLVQQTSSAGKTERHFTHLNLSGAMLGLNVTLLFSEISAVNGHLCMAVTFVGHFFLMATFAWMTVEGLILYVYILRRNIRNQALGWRKYVIGWGAAVIVSVTTLVYGLAKGSYIYDDLSTGRYDRICWLTNENNLSWGATGPILAILVMNCVILARVLCVIVRLSQESKQYKPSYQHSISEEGRSLKVNEVAGEQAMPFVVFAAFMKLFPLLGVTWILGWIPTFFAGYDESEVCGTNDTLYFGLTVAHTVLNGLQGVFVFVICVLKDKYVRKSLKRRLDGAFQVGHHHKTSRTSGAPVKKAMSG